MRNVILHYHFFKNAGTSVDELLKTNFPGYWVSREFDDGGHTANISKVEQWVRQEKDAIAFSTHTAMLPPPAIEGVNIFPVLFVRHPIDRIASVYAFERKQKGNNGFGAVLARNTTLAGYIEVRLVHDRQCRNFHVARLAQMFKGDEGDETSLALRALEALPFVGLVEEFDRSIERLVEYLIPHFPEFRPVSVAQNVTRDYSVPLEQRLENIRIEIGDTCYARLLEENVGDMAIFDSVRGRWSA